MSVAGRARGVNAGLCGAFFLSGAAALLFETLWFRLAGLALGNGIWASTAVLASFMTGLAIGNAVAARRGESVSRPLRMYAALEAATAVLGVALVLTFPAVAARLGPALGAFTSRPALLQLARGAVAFALMLLPAAAMGTTLPLLARSLTSATGSFAVALGRLYGWNTIGGVFGALAGEIAAIPALGLRGTALLAGGLSLLAAATALAVGMALTAADTGQAAVDPTSSRTATVPAGPSGRPLARLLAAALLCGATLLALEVVWFRFLQLFVFGTQLAFAVMLATVLAGIGAGGLAAAGWLRRRPDAQSRSALVAIAAGCCTLMAYVAFDPVAMVPGWPALARVLVLSLALMLPTSLLSGLLFALVGAAVRRELNGDASAAGWLTLANTVGAAGGAPLAALLLLPVIGIERALFALALVYGLAAALLLPPLRGRGRLELLAAATVFAGLLALFPFGLMQGRFLRVVLAAEDAGRSRVVAFREGLTETAVLTQDDWGGRPVYQRLLTNAHSMTSSTFYARRYMKLFAYLPLAIRPQSRRALLISYGLGNTAEALLRSPRVERLEVVDISSSVLGLSPLVPRDGVGDPLADRRTRVLVEDGRFHLLSTRERYDLITAEPPPPHAAGVVNLYTREYFELVRRRLVPGGVATHWLPVNQLSLAEAKAIGAAFCREFEDCSLWTGTDRDWILLGTNGATAPAEEELSQLWREPSTASDLQGIAIERPEQLGTQFIADAASLASWTAGVPPLVDDRPGALASPGVAAGDQAEFRRLMQAADCAGRFSGSDLIRRLWPAGLRSRTLDWFAWRDVLDRHFRQATPAQRAADLWDTLERTSLRTLPLLLMDSDPRLRETARLRWAEGRRHPVLSYHLAAAALADRDYSAAAQWFASAQVLPGSVQSPALLRGVALALGGRRAEARSVLEGATGIEPAAPAAIWREWLLQRISAPAPVGSAVP